VPHIARFRSVGDLRPRADRRDGVQRRDIHGDDIAALAELERAQLIAEAERRSAAGRGDAHRVRRGQGPGARPRLVEQRQQAQLVERIEVVVAGGAIGSERDRHAGREQLGHLGDPRRQLQIRRRARAHVRAAAREQRAIAVREMDRVRDARVRPE